MSNFNTNGSFSFVSGTDSNTNFVVKDSFYSTNTAFSYSNTTQANNRIVLSSNKFLTYYPIGPLRPTTGIVYPRGIIQ